MTNKEMIFPDGMNLFMPNERMPDFIITQISVDPDRFINWMNQNRDKTRAYKNKNGNETSFFRFEVRKAKNGNHYIALNTYGIETAPIDEKVVEQKLDEVAKELSAKTPDVKYPDEEINPADIPF